VTPLKDCKPATKVTSDKDSARDTYKVTLTWLTSVPAKLSQSSSLTLLGDLEMNFAHCNTKFSTQGAPISQFSKVG
jgi:hypothetical protein